MVDLLMNRVVQLMGRGDWWTALAIAVVLVIFRRLVRLPEHLRRPVQRVSVVGAWLAIGYALMVAIESLLGVALQGVRSAAERGGVVLLLAYLAWEGLNIGLARLRSAVKVPDMRTERQLETSLSVIRWVGRLIILFIVAATLMDIFHVDITPLVASVGIAGLALGLGAQKLVQDVINGLFILLEGQFHVGDGVAIGEVAGSVEEMTLRVTKVRDFSGVLHIIPNSEIRTVANRTKDWARAIAEVGVAYGSDLGKVEAVLTQVGQALYAETPDGMFLETPFPLGPEALGDSAIVYRLVARVQPGQQWTAQRLMRRRIKEAFDREGITIPFPQMDVHFYPAQDGSSSAAR